MPPTPAHGAEKTSIKQGGLWPPQFGQQSTQPELLRVPQKASHCAASPLSNACSVAWTYFAPTASMPGKLVQKTRGSLREDPVWPAAVMPTPEIISGGQLFAGLGSP